MLYNDTTDDDFIFVTMDLNLKTGSTTKESISYSYGLTLCKNLRSLYSRTLNSMSVQYAIYTSTAYASSSGAGVQPGYIMFRKRYSSTDYPGGVDILFPNVGGDYTTAYVKIFKLSL